jgi:hypothetical protein
VPQESANRRVPFNFSEERMNEKGWRTMKRKELK